MLYIVEEEDGLSQSEERERRRIWDLGLREGGGLRPLFLILPSGPILGCGL
jgi:hypothetical protein